MYAAPFRDRETSETHVVFSAKARPDRRSYVLCGRPVAPMMRLSAHGRPVPSTCEACTRSLTALAELFGMDE